MPVHQLPTHDELLADLTSAVTATMVTPWDDRVPDLRIQLEAAAARIEVAEHVRKLAGQLEDRLGLNTWEAIRARHHERLEHTRAMLEDAHLGAVRHLLRGRQGGVVFDYPVKTDASLPPNVFELRDRDGRVLARETFTVEPGTLTVRDA